MAWLPPCAFLAWLRHRSRGRRRRRLHGDVFGDVTACRENAREERTVVLQHPCSLGPLGPDLHLERPAGQPKSDRHAPELGWVQREFEDPKRPFGSETMAKAGPSAALLAPGREAESSCTTAAASCCPTGATRTVGFGSGSARSVPDEERLATVGVLGLSPRIARTSGISPRSVRGARRSEANAASCGAPLSDWGSRGLGSREG